jgi:hypothetical protein
VRRAKWAKVKERIDGLKPKKSPYGALSTPRAALHKRRKKQGLRCLCVLVSENAVDAVIKLGFLQPEDRSSRTALQTAFSAYIHSNLVQNYYYTPWATAAREQRAQNNHANNEFLSPGAARQHQPNNLRKSQLKLLPKRPKQPKSPQTTPAEDACASSGE